MGDPISSLSNLVLTVGKLAYEEAIYLGSVAEKLERLRTELIWMKCFLKDAAGRRSRQEIVNAWVAEVRANAYAAEDIIDTFDIKIASSKSSNSCNILKQAPDLHEMGNKIDELVGRITDLNRRAQVYGINPLHGGEMETLPRRETFPDYEIEGDVVGFDSYIKQLVSVLQDKLENQKYDIVTVSGMGGLGKTTLGNRVYQHNEIRSHFGCLAWASISQQFQKRDVWQNILLQLESPNEQRRRQILELTITELQQQLLKKLLESKCLVVLDDLWRNQDWDTLKAAFPRGRQDSSSSKILITTRNEGVAKDELKRFLLTPACLDEDQSWELLHKILFPPSTQDNEGSKIVTDKKELAKKMVQHCGGLPLAVRVLGGLLTTKVTLDEWKKVDEQIVSQIARGGSGGQENQGVRNILASSYDDLPAHLKSCFIYMAQFPEDYEINMDRLVEMWIAEGMVEAVAVHWEEEQEELEDVGDSYLWELMRRSMILPGERRDGNTLETCRLHDLMRDLCLSKAREENMLQIMNQKVRDENSEIYSKSVACTVWRLAMHGKVNLKHLHQNPHLRSLWFFDDIDFEEGLTFDGVFSEITWEWKVNRRSRQFWIFMSREYKFLRVLNLEGVSLRRSPYEIGELIYLKMLVFGGIYGYVKLPSSLGKLRRLQTLYFQPWTWFAQIPDVMWKLVQLRHLYLPRRVSSVRKIPSIGKWRNMRKLINIPLKDEGNIERLGEMTQLRVLQVVLDRRLNQKLVEAFSRTLVNLRLLESLAIFDFNSESPPMDVRSVLIALQGCPHLYKLVLDMKLKSLPTDSQMFPATITHLTLIRSRLLQDPMPILEKLPCLQYLGLEKCFIGEEMVCPEGGFPNLDSLSLIKLKNLKMFIIPEGAMSKLRRMNITYCFFWENAPNALRAIKSLKELTIKDMPKRLTDKLVPGGEDYEKVKHIPVVRITHNLSSLTIVTEQREEREGGRVGDGDLCC